MKEWFRCLQIREGEAGGLVRVTGWVSKEEWVRVWRGSEECGGRSDHGCDVVGCSCG